MEAQSCSIITQKCLLLEALVSNTCPLITFKLAFMFSNSLKYMFLREVGRSIFRVGRKHIFGTDIVSVLFGGLVFLFWYLFFLLISNPCNECTLFPCACPIQCYEPWKVSTKYFLINPLPLPSGFIWTKQVLLSLSRCLRCPTESQQTCQET